MTFLLPARVGAAGREKDRILLKELEILRRLRPDG